MRRLRRTGDGHQGPMSSWTGAGKGPFRPGAHDHRPRIRAPNATVVWRSATVMVGFAPNGTAGSSAITEPRSATSMTARHQLRALEEDTDE